MRRILFATVSVLAAAAVATPNAVALVGGTFQPVASSMLPSGNAGYDAASCPAAAVCLVAGSAHGRGIITRSSDGGRSWATRDISDSAALTTISCPTALVCYAAGVAGGDQHAVGFASQDGGNMWSVSSVPPSAYVDAIACASAEQCIAVGNRSGPSGYTSTVLATSDGGVSWDLRSAPAPFLDAAYCTDPAHCWVAGQGVWSTADLGANWTDKSPPDPLRSSPPGPNTGFGGIATWDYFAGIAFVSASAGFVGGGNSCGGAGVAQCQGAVYHTTDGGASWQLWNSSLDQAFAWRITCRASSCIYAADAFQSSVLLRTSDGVAWAPIQSLPVVAGALACNPDGTLCIVAGNGHSGSAVYVLGVTQPPVTNQPGVGAGNGTGTNPAQSSLATSLAGPAALTGAPLTTLLNALIVLVLVLLVTFPAHLFNRTYDENHATIRAFWERHFGWTQKLRRVRAPHGSARMGVASFAVVVLAGGILGALLDPAFGANGRTLALFLGVVLALSTGAGISGLAAGAYRRARGRHEHWELRGLPSGLIVAAACVLVSRLVNFQPGYLYGLIGGVAFSGHLNRREVGHEIALVSAATLVVAVSAWLIWVPVSDAAAASHAPFGWVLLQNFLAAVFVSGLVGLIIGLVPLRFLPGEKLLGWHRGVWGAMFAVTAFALLEVMLRPQSASAHVASVPFWTTVGLFLAFAAASIMFWGYFRSRSSHSAVSNPSRPPSPLA